jgi:hypothetical protein
MSSDGWSDGQEMIVQMKAQKMRILRAQMDGQMVRITQMKSSEDEDSDGSDGWSDGQDMIVQMRSSEDEDSEGSDGWSDGQDDSDEELRR